MDILQPSLGHMAGCHGIWTWGGSFLISQLQRNTTTVRTWPWKLFSITSVVFYGSMCACLYTPEHTYKHTHKHKHLTHRDWKNKMSLAEAKRSEQLAEGRKWVKAYDILFFFFFLFVWRVRMKPAWSRTCWFSYSHVWPNSFSTFS